MLADEPVSMLDVSIRLDVLNLLLKDEERLAALFITHDIASARYFAEDTLVMYVGRTVEAGPSDEVIKRSKHPYTQLLISAAPNISRPADAPFQARGEIPSLITPPTRCRFHLRCPHAMPVCREHFPGRTELGGEARALVAVSVLESWHWLPPHTSSRRAQKHKLRAGRASVRVNHMGYATGAAKRANHIASGSGAAVTFSVRNASGR